MQILSPGIICPSALTLYCLTSSTSPHALKTAWWIQTYPHNPFLDARFICVFQCVCVYVCVSGWRGSYRKAGQAIGNTGCRGEEVGLGIKKRGPLFVGNLAQPHWGTGGTSSELPHPRGEDLGRLDRQLPSRPRAPLVSPSRYFFSSLCVGWPTPAARDPSGRGDFGAFEGSTIPKDSDCPRDIAGHQQQLLSFLSWRNLHHGSTLAELCQATDANLKQLHIVQFHLYGFLERSKLWGQKTDPWLPGAGEAWGVIKGTLWGWMKMWWSRTAHLSTFIGLHTWEGQVRPYVNCISKTCLWCS